MARALEPNATKGKRKAGQVVGYLRVSSLDQKELRQLEGITLDKRFVDKASGLLSVTLWIGWPGTWTICAESSSD